MQIHSGPHQFFKLFVIMMYCRIVAYRNIPLPNQVSNTEELMVKMKLNGTIFDYSCLLFLTNLGVFITTIFQSMFFNISGGINVNT